jgi:hypothetical protein
MVFAESRQRTLEHVYENQKQFKSPFDSLTLAQNDSTRAALARVYGSEMAARQRSDEPGISRISYFKASSTRLRSLRTIRPARVCP